MMPAATFAALGSCELPTKWKDSFASRSRQARVQPARPAPMIRLFVVCCWLIDLVLRGLLRSFTVSPNNQPTTLNHPPKTLNHPPGVNLLQRIRKRLCRPGPSALPPGSTRAERGRYGEDLAERFCKKNLGYRVLARNWVHQKDELDLICLDGEVLVFIEVRSRAKDALVSGYASVNRHKKKILLRGCKSYLKQLQNPPKHFRFDIIDVTLAEGELGEVRHYANVPLFHKHYTA